MTFNTTFSMTFSSSFPAGCIYAGIISILAMSSAKIICCTSLFCVNLNTSSRMSLRNLFGRSPALGALLQALGLCLLERDLSCFLGICLSAIVSAVIALSGSGLPDHGVCGCNCRGSSGRACHNRSGRKSCHGKYYREDYTFNGTILCFIHMKAS